MKIDLIMAEFGDRRQNAGGTLLSAEDRLEPTLSSFKRHFPEADVYVYTDQPWEDTNQYRVMFVKEPLFDRKHPRYGWRCNDLYQAHGLLSSKADIAIAVDSDMLIVNPLVRTIIPLATKFGLCMPVNGRHLVCRDAKSDSDGGKVLDDSRGQGMCHATAFWAFNTHDKRFRSLLSEYGFQITTAARHNAGARGPLALWRAEWETGISPYTLPIAWCVTASNMGLGGEIILHTGHDLLVEHYKELIEKWKPA